MTAQDPPRPGYREYKPETIEKTKRLRQWLRPPWQLTGEPFEYDGWSSDRELLKIPLRITFEEWNEALWVWQHTVRTPRFVAVASHPEWCYCKGTYGPLGRDYCAHVSILLYPSSALKTIVDHKNEERTVAQKAATFLEKAGVLILVPEPLA